METITEGKFIYLFLYLKYIAHLAKYTIQITMYLCVRRGHCYFLLFSPQHNGSENCGYNHFYNGNDCARKMLCYYSYFLQVNNIITPIMFSAIKHISHQYLVRGLGI